MSTLVIWQAVVLGSNIILTLLSVDQYVTIALVIMAILLFILILLGFFICFCHKDYWAIVVGCFSFWAFLWWVGLTVAGIVLIVIYTQIKKVLTDVCENTSNDTF